MHFFLKFKVRKYIKKKNIDQESGSGAALVPAHEKTWLIGQ
jgi:hypothetical protein